MLFPHKEEGNGSSPFICTAEIEKRCLTGFIRLNRLVRFQLPLPLK